VRFSKATVKEEVLPLDLELRRGQENLLVPEPIRCKKLRVGFGGEVRSEMAEGSESERKMRLRSHLRL
jgi:hypothetical protein